MGLELFPQLKHKNMSFINNFVAYETIFHLFLWSQFIRNIFSWCIWYKFELSKTGASLKLGRRYKTLYVIFLDVYCY